MYKILFMAIASWLCQARVLTAASRQARLSSAEPMPSYFYTNIDGYPGTYSFGYDVSEPNTGNTQFRTEERYPNGTVVGSYGYVDAFGRPHHYRYVADENGYRVMRERKNVYGGQATTVHPIIRPESIESSITWTRPKKKNKLENNFLTNFRKEQRNNIIPNTIIERPSYYVNY